MGTGAGCTADGSRRIKGGLVVFTTFDTNIFL
jgi:hypothetical protein